MRIAFEQPLEHATSRQPAFIGDEVLDCEIVEVSENFAGYAPPQPGDHITLDLAADARHDLDGRSAPCRRKTPRNARQETRRAEARSLTAVVPPASMQCGSINPASRPTISGQVLDGRVPE